MECRLPLEKKPFMSAYQSLAFSFGIVEANTALLPQLLCAQFINCVYTADSPKMKYYVFDYDLWFDALGLMEIISYEIFPHDPTTDLFHECNVLKRRLAAGYYVYGTLNQRYVSQTQKHEDYEHDYLLYGFDDAREVFLTVGYIQGIYRDYEISYHEFYLATQHTRYTGIDIRFFRIRREFVMPPLPVSLIASRMEDYVHSVIPEYRGSEPFQKGVLKCGIAAWEQLETEILQGAEQNHFLDLRYIRSYVEHKAAMLKRVEYFTAQHLLQDRAILCRLKALYAQTSHFLTWGLKYNLSNHEHLSARIAEEMQKINAAEPAILLQMAEALRGAGAALAGSEGREKTEISKPRQ